MHWHTRSLLLGLVFYCSSCGLSSWLDFLTGEKKVAIEAYARQNEIAPGQPVEISASAHPQTLAQWKVERVGWYGGQRRKRYADGEASLFPQTAGKPDPETGLVEARWPVSFQIETGANWPAGVYIVTVSALDKETHAIFVINDGQPHDFMLQLSMSTYAAYNAWGGLSLYQNTTGLDLPRASHVSLDRPFPHNGLGDFQRFERKLVEWAERAGYDVGYTTNMGVDAEPNLSSKANMLLLVGHDEYWSEGERRNVERAVENGMHLSSFSGNTAYWRIHYHPSWDGRPRRVIECHKIGDKAEESGTKRWVAYDPEGRLLGAQFGWIIDSWAPLIFTNTTHPLFEGTGINSGDEFPGLMGAEIDGYYTPASADILGYSPILSNSEHLGVGAVVVKTWPSGAQVFSASTLRWGAGLEGPYASWRLQRLTANILAAAGEPKIDPYYLAEAAEPSVRRWKKTSVSTLTSDVPEPRSIVKSGNRIFFIANGRKEVYELFENGDYELFQRPDTLLTGLAADEQGNLWATSMGGHAILRSTGGPFEIVSSGERGDADGPLIEASFNNPVQITTDGERLLVIEHNRSQSKLRLIQNGVVTTLPKTPSVAYTGLPVTGSGLLIGLADNRLWTYAGGKYKRFSGKTGGWYDAPAENARYRTPYYIRQTAGGFFVIERYGHRVRYVSDAGGSWTLAGAGIGYADGSGDRARFTLPYGLLELEDGSLLVSDAGNEAIRKIVIEDAL